MGVSTGAKRLRRWIEMRVIREINSSGGVHGTETDRGNFIQDINLDRQPMEWSEYWCGMNIHRYTNYKYKTIT